MLKNIINIFIFFILCLSNMGFQSHGFIAEETWLNLYNTIDEGLEKIDEQNFTYELSWADSSIKDKVNWLIEQHYALTNPENSITDCIEKDLAPSHIIDIAFWNLKTLSDKLWDSCKISIKKIDIASINTIQQIIKKHYQNTKKIADEKSRQIQKIWSVGLYTDGILENSSFDLIDDIEKIDAIIFTQEIEYIWEEYEDTSELFESKQKEKTEEINNNITDPAVISENNWESLATQIDNWLSNQSNTNNIELNVLTDFNSDNSYFGVSSNYVCVEDKSDHGFNPELIDTLVDRGNSNNSWWSNSSWSDNNSWWNNSWWNSSSWNSNSWDKKQAESISWWYEKINDNAMWPCSNFFCITVDFIVHEHQLLGWGTNISIEYLIDRSNQHLRKFANASLAPAKMTTQNFELWLKDLNLSEMFHMSFQVSTKPVPILNVNKNNRKDSNEYSSDTLLEKYYKANDLDYQRRNDITRFLDNEKEYKTLLNSVDLDKRVVIEKQKTLEAHKALMAAKNEIISNNVYKKVTYETLWDFWDQFTELNNFTTSIRDYTQNLSDIVAAMIKIPIDW